LFQFSPVEGFVMRTEKVAGEDPLVVESAVVLRPMVGLG
jgi:hypothetical protein